MATRISSDWQGNVISRNGKKVTRDDDVEEKLVKAAYKATGNTAPTANTVTPVYDSAGNLNHVINNSRGLARIEAEKNNFSPTVSQPYTQAYNTSVNANQEAIDAAVSTINAQKPAIQNQYEDLAKQAYASYMRGNATIPYQTQNLATGAQDNLALQQRLAYENSRDDISQNKAQALLALESQIAQAQASGAANLAELQQQYANLQAQYLQDAQRAAYEQQQAQQKAAYAQELAMAKANAPTYAKAEKTPVPTRSDVETAYGLYSNGSISKAQYDAVVAAYTGGFGIQSAPTPKVTPNIQDSGYEAAPNNPKLNAAIQQATQQGDISPLVFYYDSLGIYTDEEIAEIINRLTGQLT